MWVHWFDFNFQIEHDSPDENKITGSEIRKAMLEHISCFSDEELEFNCYFHHKEFGESNGLSSEED